MWLVYYNNVIFWFWYHNFRMFWFSDAHNSLHNYITNGRVQFYDAPDIQHNYDYKSQSNITSLPTIDY